MVAAATTEIETRKLNEWQGWTGDNGRLNRCLIVSFDLLSLTNPSIKLMRELSSQCNHEL